MVKYLILLLLLIICELLYFKLAERFNIIDKPNGRSSHSSIVLRGGGIIFLIAVWLWGAFFGMHYGLFLAAVTLTAGVSFIDDIHSLPDGLRLSVHFLAMGLLIWQLFLTCSDSAILRDSGWIAKILFIILALIVCVGATNIYNFMDGINGILAGYSLAVLLPLVLVNQTDPFVEDSYLTVMCLSVLVFSFFNFRNKGKAKCFAGDVGSVGMAFILLFAIGLLAVKTGDVTWLIFLLLYGIDGCLTICHRIILHENLGEAHRKHAYQLMANELKMSHPVVSVIYMAIQLLISIGFIYLCPIIADSAGMTLQTCHWLYLAVAFLVLSAAYLLFMKKYYHLHEEYQKTVTRQ